MAAEAIRGGRYLAIAVSMLNVIIAPDVVYIGGALAGFMTCWLRLCSPSCTIAGLNFIARACALNRQSS